MADTDTPTCSYLGSLKDLGLGNPDGIPSSLQDAPVNQREQYGQALLGALVPIQDTEHYSCIDGRRCMHNGDGSPAQLRGHQAGGTSMLLSVALNSGSIMARQWGPSMPLTTFICQIEQDYTILAGVRPSAHLGGCGKARGTVEDSHLIATKPAVLNVAKTLMTHPDMAKYSRLRYSDELADHVRTAAAGTARLLDDEGYNGDEYVQGMLEREPAGVEDLQTADDKFHGHKENAVVLLLSRGKQLTLSPALLDKLGLGEVFTVTLDDSITMARTVGGDEPTVAAKALIANLAEHAAVADRLAHETTPVYLLVA